MKRALMLVCLAACGGPAGQGGRAANGDDLGAAPVHIPGGPHRCSDHVTFGVWDAAVCFVDVDNQLECAGRVGNDVYGPSFTPVGMDGVDQIMATSTVNVATGSAMCVHRTDGTAWCTGNNGADASNPCSSWGQYRTADGLQPGRKWKQWGTRSDIVE